MRAFLTDVKQIRICRSLSLSASLSLVWARERARYFHRRVLSACHHSIFPLPPHECIPHDSLSPISSVSRMTRIMTGFAAKCVGKCICEDLVYFFQRMQDFQRTCRPARTCLSFAFTCVECAVVLGRRRRQLQCRFHGISLDLAMTRLASRSSSRAKRSVRLPGMS